MPTLRSTATALALMSFAASAGAQTTSSQSSPPSPADIAALRQDLKNMVRAQEEFFVRNNHYTPTVTALTLTPTDGITLKVLEASQRGWAGTGAVGKGVVSCVIFVGGVSVMPKTEKGAVPKEEGVPLCDGDPPGIQNEKGTLRR